MANCFVDIENQIEKDPGSLEEFVSFRESRLYSDFSPFCLIVLRARRFSSALLRLNRSFLSKGTVDE